MQIGTLPATAQRSRRAGERAAFSSSFLRLSLVPSNQCDHVPSGCLVGQAFIETQGLLAPKRPRYHYWIASMDEVHASLKKLFAREILKIYVGHGGPLNGLQTRKYFL